MTTLLTPAAASPALAATPGNRARFARITAPVLLEFLREHYGFAPAK
jgi:hypothetical protein